MSEQSNNDNVQLSTVLELKLGEKVQTKEIVSELESCGYEAKFVGQGHDTMRDVEEINYIIEHVETDGESNTKTNQ